MENLLNYVLTLDWVAIATTVGVFLTAGTGLSLVVSLGKRVLHLKSITTDAWRKAAVQLSVLVWGALAVVAEYVLTNQNTAFSQLFGSTWPGLIVAATVVHRIGTIIRNTKTVSTLADAYKLAKSARSELTAPIAVQPPEELNRAEVQPVTPQPFQ